MKFLTSLNEALRNIPQDLPGEDEWGEAPRPITVEEIVGITEDYVSYLETNILEHDLLHRPSPLPWFEKDLEFLDRIFKARTFLDAAQQLTNNPNRPVTYFISGASVPTKQHLERFEKARSGFKYLRNKYEAAKQSKA